MKIVSLLFVNITTDLSSNNLLESPRVNLKKNQVLENDNSVQGNKRYQILPLICL